MAIIYLWSGASGLGDGSDWANAYTTQEAAMLAVQPGDVIYKANDHSEIFPYGQSWGGPGESLDAVSEMIMVDRLTNLYAPQSSSPTLTCNNGLAIYGYIRILGDYYEATSISFMDNVECDETKVRVNSSITLGGDKPKYFYNCIFDWPVAGQNFKYIFLRAYRVVMEGCVFIMPSAGTSVYSLFWPYSSSRVVDVEVRGCDFSSFDPTYPLCSFAVAPYEHRSYKFHRCKINVNQAFIRAASPQSIDGDEIEVLGCDFGAGYPESRRYTYRGDVLTDAVTVADDGNVFSDVNSGTPLSQRFEPKSNCHVATPLNSIEMRMFVSAAGQKTITIDGLENFTLPLTTSEAWITVRSAETAGSSKTDTSSGRVVIGGAALSASGVTWLSAPGGARAVSLSASVTLDSPCLIVVTVHLGRYEAGKSLWINPRPRVTAG